MSPLTLCDFPDSGVGAARYQQTARDDALKTRTPSSLRRCVALLSYRIRVGSFSGF